MVHYLILSGILLLGTLLRFWQLSSKPIWVDEVFTALFSLGESFDNLPVNQLVPLSQIPDLFTLKSSASCGEIAHHLAVQSTHPPLFFCLMHQWLTWVEPLGQPLLWSLRSLPALFGVAAIAAIYALNRLAFSPKAGLLGGAIAAVSPFGVYQSQEARHYTLPILLITLALFLLIQINQDFRQHPAPDTSTPARQNNRSRVLIWLSWIAINSLSFYVHYFCFLAFAAQVMTLGVILARHRKRTMTQIVGSAIACLIPLLLYLPWFPIFLQHFTSPNAGWLPKPQHIAPLFQSLIGMVLMMVSPPVESQPLWVIIPAALLALLFLAWLAPQTYRGLRSLWRTPQTAEGALILSVFIAAVLLQFAAVVYILGKDITVAPRYHFVYYPAFCALLGASLSEIGRKTRNRGAIALFWVSLLSSLCVIFNLAFQKPYYPLPVAEQLNELSGSLVVVMAYRYPLHLSMGLSYAVALEGIRSDRQNTDFVFLNAQVGYDLAWTKLSELTASPQTLWAFAPGLIHEFYPPRLDLKGGTSCIIDPENYYHIGIPYQRYRCQ